MLFPVVENFCGFFAEYTFLSLVVLNERLTRMSIMLRLNEQEEVVTTPLESRSSSHESLPETYCSLSGMSSGKCAAGCTTLNGSIFVCGKLGNERIRWLCELSEWFCWRRFFCDDFNECLINLLLYLIIFEISYANFFEKIAKLFGIEYFWNFRI